MFTLTFTWRAPVFVLIAALALAAALAAGSVFGSDDAPDEIIQGDLNCDGSVNASDTLTSLLYAGGLVVEQTEPCPDVGTLAAIPGPPGPEGPKGDLGPPGPSGISGFTTVQSQIGSGGHTPTIHDAECPSGMIVVGGGAQITGAASYNDVSLHSSAPRPDMAAWRGIASEVNGTALDWGIIVTAFCANP